MEEKEEPIGEIVTSDSTETITTVEIKLEPKPIDLKIALINLLKNCPSLQQVQSNPWLFTEYMAQIKSLVE